MRLAGNETVLCKCGVVYFDREVGSTRRYCDDCCVKINEKCAQAGRDYHVKRRRKQIQENNRKIREPEYVPWQESVKYVLEACDGGFGRIDDGRNRASELASIAPEAATALKAVIVRSTRRSR